VPPIERLGLELGNNERRLGRTRVRSDFDCECLLNHFKHMKPIVMGADVTEVGIYSARVIKAYEVAGVVGGTNQGLDSFTLVQATTNIPARLGTRFGFHYTIRGTPSNAPILLTMVGEHPPLTNPKTGRTQARDEYELQSWIGQTYTSFLFEEQWELIPGEWKFEVWHEGKKLCNQSFTVVPDAKPKDQK
jgi:hypothetical protein